MEGKFQGRKILRIVIEFKFTLCLVTAVRGDIGDEIIDYLRFGASR